jgi:arabinan endo-1,5-alpha-L-arabinosidase
MRSTVPYTTLLTAAVVLALMYVSIADPARPSPVVHDPVVHDPVVHDPVVHDPVVHDPVVHDPVVHDPVVHDPVVHDPVVHDLVIVKEGYSYYLFSTGRGITVHTSKDGRTWGGRTRAFAEPMPWTAAAVPGSTDHYWAPEVVRRDGRWHLYYSVSTFGKNRSVIGLATNPTLDPESPDYCWRDDGPVVESKAGDDYNAIDPNVVVDEKGRPWLSFGSFWGGIRLVPLDRKTGKPPKEASLVSLASRPNTPEIQGSVEAPFLMRRGGFYCLFVSFDFCCRGVDSTYNIRVGRARQIAGPYADRDGRPMLEGGGTPVVTGAGRWRGPGHNSVFRDGKDDWLVYHAYDAEDRGTPKLRMERLAWDAEGWPRVERAGGDTK